MFHSPTRTQRDDAADSAGYTLQTLIITAILVLVAVGASVIIYASLTSSTQVGSFTNLDANDQEVPPPLSGFSVAYAQSTENANEVQAVVSWAELAPPIRDEVSYTCDNSADHSALEDVMLGDSPTMPSRENMPEPNFTVASSHETAFCIAVVMACFESAEAGAELCRTSPDYRFRITKASAAPNITQSRLVPCQDTTCLWLSWEAPRYTGTTDKPNLLYSIQVANRLETADPTETWADPVGCTPDNFILLPVTGTADDDPAQRVQDVQLTAKRYDANLTVSGATGCPIGHDEDAERFDPVFSVVSRFGITSSAIAELTAPEFDIKVMVDTNVAEEFSPRQTRESNPNETIRVEFSWGDDADDQSSIDSYLLSWSRADGLDTAAGQSPNSVSVPDDSVILNLQNGIAYNFSLRAVDDAAVSQPRTVCTIVATNKRYLTPSVSVSAAPNAADAMVDWDFTVALAPNPQANHCMPDSPTSFCGVPAAGMAPSPHPSPDCGGLQTLGYKIRIVSNSNNVLYNGTNAPAACQPGTNNWKFPNEICQGSAVGEMEQDVISCITGNRATIPVSNPPGAASNTPANQFNRFLVEVIAGACGGQVDNIDVLNPRPMATSDPAPHPSYPVFHELHLPQSLPTVATPAGADNPQISVMNLDEETGNVIDQPVRSASHAWRVTWQAPQLDSNNLPPFYVDSYLLRLAGVADVDEDANPSQRTILSVPNTEGAVTTVEETNLFVESASCIEAAGAFSCDVILRDTVAELIAGVSVGYAQPDASEVYYSQEVTCADSCADRPALPPIQVELSPMDDTSTESMEWDVSLTRATDNDDHPAGNIRLYRVHVEVLDADASGSFFWNPNLFRDPMDPNFSPDDDRPFNTPVTFEDPALALSSHSHRQQLNLERLLDLQMSNCRQVDSVATECRLVVSSDSPIAVTIEANANDQLGNPPIWVDPPSCTGSRCEYYRNYWRAKVTAAPGSDPLQAGASALPGPVEMATFPGFTSSTNWVMSWNIPTEVYDLTKPADEYLYFVEYELRTGTDLLPGWFYVPQKGLAVGTMIETTSIPAPLSAVCEPRGDSTNNEAANPQRTIRCTLTTADGATGMVPTATIRAIRSSNAAADALSNNPVEEAFSAAEYSLDTVCDPVCTIR